MGKQWPVHHTDTNWQLCPAWEQRYTLESDFKGNSILQLLLWKSGCCIVTLIEAKVWSRLLVQRYSCFLNRPLRQVQLDTQKVNPGNFILLFFLFVQFFCIHLRHFIIYIFKQYLLQKYYCFQYTNFIFNILYIRKNIQHVEEILTNN